MMKTYIVEIPAELTFTVEEQDGIRTVKYPAWFDCRSSSDQMAAQVMDETGELVDFDTAQEVLAYIPGKGEIL